jgi:hypothetical protein
MQHLNGVGCKMRRLLYSLFLLLCSVAASGCASIVTGQNQSVSVNAIGSTGNVNEARCQLTNNKGTWFVTTPGSATVQRSYEDMALRCEHPRFETGLLTVKSTTKGMAFGNILFGGIIGAGVDMSTGAAYDYPALITVAMGRPISAGEVSPAVIAPSAAVAPPPAQVAPAPVAAPPPPAPVATLALPAAPAPAAVARAAPVAVTQHALPVALGAVPSAPAPGTGSDSYSAEKLGRSLGCADTRVNATLVGRGPGYESYAMKCSNGETLLIRCELGNCRSLR